MAYVGPGDVVSGAVAWYGLRAYSLAQIGSNVLDVRANDGTTNTFVSLASGALDVASISSFLLTHGSPGTISKLYDQTGNANHLVQATVAKQPTLTLSGLGTLPVMTFNGTNSELDLASFSQALPFSLSGVFTRTANFLQFAAILASAGLSVYFGYRNTLNTFEVVSGNFAPSGFTSDNAWHATIGTCDAADIFLYVDAQARIDLGAPATSTMSGALSMGNDSGGDSLTGMIGEAGVWPVTITNPQAAALIYNKTNWWFPPSGSTVPPGLGATLRGGMILRPRSLHFDS
jgi:hypothetical protein